MKSYALPLAFLLWMTFVLAAFFLVQKPDFLQIPGGLLNLLGILLLPFWMAVLAACAGSRLLPECSAAERLTLGAAAGMTFFGLAGFGLAVCGLAKPPLLIALLPLLTAFFSFNGQLARLRADFQHAARELFQSARQAPVWIPLALAAACSLAFVMSLAPPAEDFDALLYHLPVPELWLRYGGLMPNPTVTYWYPHIIEGSFVFPLAFGLDSSAHLLHLLWLILTMLLLWLWARALWSDAVAWDALALLLTMPSLLWLASWAYTDYPLAFGGAAALYSVWKWSETRNRQWLILGGVMTGLALGAKYTSVIVPFAALLLMTAWEKDNRLRIKHAALFTAISFFTASPWLIRNWLWTGNPVFPSIWGGRFWDSFLAQTFSAPAPGIRPFEILLLPLTATLGFRDANFFDGRFGPFFLILLPVVLWAFWKFRPESPAQKRALQALALFSLLGAGLWVFGVIKSERWFQTRYLYPALIPLTLPFAAAVSRLPQLDAPRLKIRFIFRTMLALTVWVNLLNFGLQTLARNPLAVPLGIVSRREYLQKTQPHYAAALDLVNRLPQNAKVYLLFEPRSYGMKAEIYPDIFNANFAHDLWRFKTPRQIVAAWKEQGYAYVLVSKIGAEFIFRSSPELRAPFQQTLDLLTLAASSPNGASALYKIP